MPISRLDNFLRNPSGRLIYVDPNSFDATDSFENRGDSLTRPFKTIQRAVIESARFSYVPGIGNDLNDNTTILVYPGTYYIDNRPGFSIEKDGSTVDCRKRTSFTTWTSGQSINQFNENSNFDIFNPNNDLYKFNSVEGGIILPRGTSIVGLDLRKTKIRPLYVPDPEDELVERASYFKVTGNCYFTSFTFFDADPNTPVYKNYADTRVNPLYSHHKLTTFTYADGTNKVVLGNRQTDLTDLQMYYYKVSLAYGQVSGRNIPDFPVDLGFEPLQNEYEIVGDLSGSILGISSIRSGSGDGTGNLNLIRVTTKDLNTSLVTPHNLTVGKTISIAGITSDSYNGSYDVARIVDNNTFEYITRNPPQTVFAPTGSQIQSAIARISSDTVGSSSPYIFNCSLRSTYGVCGLWADGSKSSGFKSIVVAQFTGISLQKDDNAFAIYDNGSYKDNLTIPNNSQLKPLHKNSRSIYKPEYENFHIRASNDAFIQCVSVFAIGFSKHFLAESGGDMSITNSNSNFGATSLESVGFKNKAFTKDDVGYITHIIPPKYENENEININWLSLDVGLTTATSNNSLKRLYIRNFITPDSPPNHKIDGYRIGARSNDNLYLEIPESGIYSSPIVMPTEEATNIITGSKRYEVQRSGGLNVIASNTLQFTTNHQFINGESVRVFSNSAILPSGLESDKVYYVITTAETNQIKLASSLDDVLNTPQIPIEINNQGGVIFVESLVSDKKPGEIGHPIQWDSIVSNWYINSTDDVDNEIYTQLKLQSSSLGESTPNTYFNRFEDNRSVGDRIFKFRYVIPKEYSIAREPEPGFIIQESNNVFITETSNIVGSTLTTVDARNERAIVDLSSELVVNNSQIVTAKTSKAHNFIVGDRIRVQNVKSTNNTTGVAQTSTYNGSFTVESVPNSTQFTYKLQGIQINPGTFTNPRLSNSNLGTIPVVSKEEYKNNFYIYKVDRIRSHIPNQRDGIYHLTILSSNVSTETNDSFEFSSKLFNQDVRGLYPKIDRDNLVQTPRMSFSLGNTRQIGKVEVSNGTHSITRESTINFLRNNRIGIGVTGITFSGSGNSTITINTDVEHKLAGISSVSIQVPGDAYPNGTFYGIPLLTSSGSYTDATCNYTASGGQVTSVQIVDSGSGFQLNQSLRLDVSGIPGTQAQILVTEISNNVGNSLSLDGFEQDNLNNVFRITSIPSSKSIQVSNWNSVGSYTPNIRPISGIAIPSAETTAISTIQFLIDRDIVEVTTTGNHNLFPGNRVLITNTGSTIYDNKYHIIIPSLTPNERNKFYFRLPYPGNITQRASGFVLKYITDPNLSFTSPVNENIGSRMNYIYDGDSTTVISSSPTPPTIRLSGISDGNTNWFKKGDYIQVQDEIIRLATNPTSNGTFNVLRGQFGTPIRSISNESLVRKIKIIPIELRRPSSLRSSGHTFEYLGYGPGNYSTAMPQNQDRKLSETEVLLSQAKKLKGGSIVYDGLNDLGESYFGNKKTIASTGEEVIVSAPIVRYVGDDVDGSDSVNLSNDTFDSLLIRNRIVVEGGPEEDQFSIFNGPVRLKNIYLSGSLLNSNGTPYRFSNLLADDLSATNATLTNLTGTNATIENLNVTGITTFKFQNNKWIQTNDNRNRFIFGSGNSGITTYSSPGGYNWLGGTSEVGIATLTSSGNLSIIGTATFKFPNNVDILSADNTPRFKFLNNGDTEFYSQVDYIWRNNSNVGIATLVGASGNLQVSGNISGSSIVAIGSITSGSSITAPTFVGNGTIPIGGIIMWSGETAPSGWQLCNNSLITQGPLADGSRRTPDLRERFVVGAGGNNPTVTGGAYTVGDIGGANSVRLTITEIPSHDHTPASYFTGTASINVATEDPTNKVNFVGNLSDINTVNPPIPTSIPTEGGIGGVTQSHENRPPYYALAFIMRVA